MVNPTKAKVRVAYTRNPIYVFYALIGIGLFLFCLSFVNNSRVGLLEQSTFNLLGDYYKYFSIIPVTLIVISAIGLIFYPLIHSLFKNRWDIASRIAVVTTVSYILATTLGGWVERYRPDVNLPGLVENLVTSTFGFPAVLMAVTTGVGLTVSLYISKTNRKLITYLLVFVGLSNILIGLNYPLDIVGGYAVGLFSFSLCMLVFGSIYNSINIDKLTKKLQAGGMEDLVLKPASVDARGSVPFFGTYKNGPIFVKVFNQDNNAADWLFKIARRIWYRRLEDEVPSLTPKRAIEHEAYLTILARHHAKVRVPEIIGVFNVSRNAYAMVTTRLDAKGLNELSKTEVTDKMLSEVWIEINNLHNAGIIHKDLRAANVMIEKKTSKPWLIDFGFSESAVNEQSFYKDNVEFIASTATKIGAKRAVAVALLAIGADGIQKATPYMQYPALSGATTSDLKKQPGLLKQIHQELCNAAGTKTAKIKMAKMTRVGKS